jgi:class 3 adenylate cyclase
MALKDDLAAWVNEIISSAWTARDGNVVPDDTSKLGLKNEAITINGTVLYADLADSTKMVDTSTAKFSAEVYKTFLYCAAQIIRANDGVITAYDGDRVMAVFIGESKNSDAAKAALQIRGAVHDVITPKIQSFYSASKRDFVVSHVTGIDTSDLFVTKTGVRGANDLVWVGRAANHAAKLSAMPATYIYITESVYKRLNAESKLASGVDMWTAIKWDTFDNSTIYRSGYRWSL